MICQKLLLEFPSRLNVAMAGVDDEKARRHVTLVWRVARSQSTRISAHPYRLVVMTTTLIPPSSAPEIPGLSIPHEFYWVALGPAPLAGMLLPSDPVPWDALFELGFGKLDIFGRALGVPGRWREIFSCC